MSTEFEDRITPEPPPAPEPYGAAPQPSSTWPMVLGIIALVFGILAALGGCVAAVGSGFLGKIASMVPEEDAQILTAVEGWMPWLIGLSVVSAVVALLLVVGGIGLLQRKAYGPKLCITWALAKIVFVVVNAVVQFMMNRAQFEAMQDDPNMAAVPSGLFGAIGAAGAVISVLWGWALPAFMLIWFARSAVRREVESWAEPMR